MAGPSRWLPKAPPVSAGSVTHRSGSSPIGDETLGYGAPLFLLTSTIDTVSREAPRMFLELMKQPRLDASNSVATSLNFVKGKLVVVDVNLACMLYGGSLCESERLLRHHRQDSMDE